MFKQHRHHLFSANIGRTRSAVIGVLLSMSTLANAQGADSRHITFQSADGDELGSATLTQTRHGVLIELDLQNLPPSTWHGFHIHENGECDASDGFKSAGGHFSAAGAEHGILVDGGPHTGDMPNQFVASDGTLKAQVLNTFATLDGGMANVAGRAVILHSGEDDYESQPSGDAGERIGCAVIE